MAGSRMGKSLSRPKARTITPRSPSAQPAATDQPVANDDDLPRNDPRFVLAISHTPWVRARAENMERMRSSLRPGESAVAYREITDKVPNWQWSQTMWTWALQSAETHGATHVVFLQDDLDVCPDFWRTLRAMLDTAYNRVLGLIANHPFSRRSVERGDKWFLTSECLGSGYSMPTKLLRQFVDWRASLPTWRIRTTNEDFLITCWVNATRRRTWHPVPSLIDHRLDIASTNIKDHYPFRRSYVRWDAAAVVGADLTSATTWHPPQPPLDFGFDSTNGNVALGLDPGHPPTRQDRAILDEHARIVRDESSGMRY